MKEAPIFLTRIGQLLPKNIFSNVNKLFKNVIKVAHSFYMYWVPFQNEIFPKTLEFSPLDSNANCPILPD